MRKLVALGAAFGALILTTHAAAQLTAVGVPTTTSDPNIQFISPLTGGTASAAGILTIKLKTDFNYTVTPGTESLPYITVRQNFTVGPLPVQINSLGFTANAKWVNGGGTVTDPVTSWQLVSNVYYGPTFTSYAIAGPDLTGSQDGNGFTVVSDGRAENDPFVLANGQTYQLYFVAFTNINALDLTPNAQPSVFTLEAGGISTFNGFAATINWQTVPEPASIVLLMPAGVLLLLRRRLAA